MAWTVHSTVCHERSRTDLVYLVFVTWASLCQALWEEGVPGQAYARLYERKGSLWEEGVSKSGSSPMDAIGFWEVLSNCLVRFNVIKFASRARCLALLGKLGKSGRAYRPSIQSTCSRRASRQAEMLVEPDTWP
jgi:hypothetical protein